MELELSGGAGLADWTIRALAISECLIGAGPLVADGDFHFLQHYFADFDIRARDQDYRDAQIERLSTIIVSLDAMRLEK